ncbi:MAG: hypothetical protein ACXVEF_01995 [Polyangiales bacterium]
MRGRAIAVVACLAATTVAARARAELTVEAKGCELDVKEVERLLAIELASVIEERKAPFPPVQVTCSAGSMTIVVDDPVTAKKLERTLPAPKPSEKGRERTFALAISQLFLTSWGELILPPPPEPVGPPKEAKGSVAATAIVKKKVVEARGPALEVSLFGGAHGRDLEHAYVDAATSLRAGVVFDERWRVFVIGAWETGSASRNRGTVEVSIASLGGGIGWRSPRVGALAFDAALTASFAWARLDGRPGSEATFANGGSGTGAELMIALGPTFLFGPLRIGAELQGGVLVPTIAGDVAGDASVRASGLFVGGGLTVGFGSTR